MTRATRLTRIKLVLNSSAFGSCTLGGSPAGVVEPWLTRLADESPALAAFADRDRASLLRRRRCIVCPYSVQRIWGKLGGCSVARATRAVSMLLQSTMTRRSRQQILLQAMPTVGKKNTGIAQHLRCFPYAVKWSDIGRAYILFGSDQPLRDAMLSKRASVERRKDAINCKRSSVKPDREKSDSRGRTPRPGTAQPRRASPGRGSASPSSHQTPSPTPIPCQSAPTLPPKQQRQQQQRRQSDAAPPSSWTNRSTTRRAGSRGHSSARRGGRRAERVGGEGGAIAAARGG